MTVPSLMALRCFDASARHASFTRAAREVHLTQGAVSHQILGLEARLGVLLFERQRSGLQLTPAGRAYWIEIAAALRQLERATQNVAFSRGGGGTLDLCVASSFGTYWLLPRLSSFVGAHPQVTLNLSTRVGLVDFATSPHDAAIEFCEGGGPGVHAEFVHALELRAFCSPSLLPARMRTRPKTVRDGAARLARFLAATPLIRHRTVPDAWPAWLEAALPHDPVPVEHLSAGPTYDLLSMALNGAMAGLGVALLPPFVAEGAEKAGQLVRLADVAWVAQKGYHLRAPEWKASLAALQLFREWLRTQRPATLADGG